MFKTMYEKARMGECFYRSISRVSDVIGKKVEGDERQLFKKENKQASKQASKKTNTHSFFFF